MKPLNMIVLFGVLSAMLVVATAALANGPDVVVIDKAQARKPPVTFPHAVHAADNDCVTCHHTAQSSDDIAGCFSCHGQDPAAPDPAAASKKENPFHILCIGCHDQQAAGPTKCGECHLKS